ncbi:MAG: signal peptidase I [Nanoarchaeota archaeon]
MGSKKTFLKRMWKFLWHEDSLASWVANIVLAFIIIKFIIYPLLSVMFGTSLPLVAVVSCSMEHQFTDCGEPDSPAVLCSSQGSGFVSDDIYWKECGDFYEARNISQDRFEKFPFDDGFNKGDVIVLKGKDPSSIEVGDVLIFEAKAESSYPIIHRVVGTHTINKSQVFETKGDHNPTQINNSRVNEYSISEDDVIGVGMVRIPYVGYLKIGFVKLISVMGL